MPANRQRHPISAAPSNPQPPRKIRLATGKLPNTTAMANAVRLHCRACNRFATESVFPVLDDSGLRYGVLAVRTGAQRGRPVQGQFIHVGSELVFGVPHL